MVFPDYLGKGGLDPVEDVPICGGVLPQGENAREELRGDLSDGRLRPHLVQRPNELRGEKACLPCANPVGVVIRLGRKLLTEVVEVVLFHGKTGEGGIEFRPRNTKK